jgi:hypothetical protein
MYENPEIMRQLVNDRMNEGRGVAAERRLLGRARRAGRRGGVISRLSRLSATPRPEPAPGRKPAPA